jgi:hypothetical protein
VDACGAEALTQDWVDGERDLSDAVLPVAVFLPDALRDDSDHRIGVVVWPECAAECRVG